MLRASALLLAFGVAVATCAASAQAQTGAPPAGIVPCPAGPPPTASPAAAATARPVSASATPLRIVPATLQLNNGTCARVVISGGTPPYTPSAGAGNVAVTVLPDGSILVAALRNGTDSVAVVDAAGRTANATVLIAPDAGVLPAAAALRLSGTFTADFAAAALTAEIARRSHLQPGARIAALAASVMPTVLTADAPWSGTLAVTLSGRDHWRDVSGIVPVTISLVAMPPLDPARLFYSDDPESVPGDQAGVLFRATLSGDAPTARLYAYHLFEQAGRQLAVLVRSHSTSHVQILGAAAGPSFTTYTGHVATVRYLQTRRAQQSIIATIDADPVLLEIGNVSEAQRLVMGIYDLRLLDGGPVDVAVVAGFDSGAPDWITLIDAPPTQPPAKDTHDRSGVYPLDAVAPITLSASILDPKYRLANSGGMSVVVGASALPPLMGKRYLGGDYGIVRPFRLTMTNMTDQPGTISLYEAPSINGVTTTMLFDGSPPVTFEVPCLQGARDAPAFRDRYLLEAFTIAPTGGGAPVVVTGEYMTDGGSSYPIALGLSVDPVLPLPSRPMCTGAAASPAPAASPLPSASP